MLGKPYQSSLIPYEDEIVALEAPQTACFLRPDRRSCCGKSTTSAFAAKLSFKFVKVRSRGRKVYCFSRRAC